MVRSFRSTLIWLGAVAVLVWSAAGTRFDPRSLADLGRSAEFVLTRWLPPDWSALPAAVEEAVITVQIAVLATALGLVAALPASFLAAANITPYPLVYGVTRTVLSFFRAVPDLVTALLFVPAFGPGPMPAMVAIAVHNFGVLGKLISELIEAAEVGPQEAVAATGAGRLPVILYGILPQVIPNVLSQVFYRFEVAVRASLVLGIVGGKGIGNLLFIDYKTFQYQAVTVEVLVIMAMVMAIDALGARARARVI